MADKDILTLVLSSLSLLISTLAAWYTHQGRVTDKKARAQSLADQAREICTELYLAGENGSPTSRPKAEKAVFLALQACDLDPRALSPQLELASALSYAHRTKEARETIQKIHHKFPDEHRAYCGTIAALLQLGDLGEAERAISGALSTDAECASSHQQLAVLRMRQGRFDEGVEAAAEAWRRNPHNPEVAGIYGRILEQAGRQEAAVYLRRAIQGGARSAQNYATLGTALVRQGRYIEGRQMYEHALAKDPNNVQALINTGALLYNIDADAAGAEQLFRRAIEVAPHEKGVYENLLVVLRAQGRHDEVAEIESSLTDLDHLATSEFKSRLVRVPVPGGDDSAPDVLEKP